MPLWMTYALGGGHALLVTGNYIAMTKGEIESASVYSEVLISFYEVACIPPPARGGEFRQPWNRTLAEPCRFSLLKYPSSSDKIAWPKSNAAKDHVGAYYTQKAAFHSHFHHATLRPSTPSIKGKGR